MPAEVVSFKAADLKKQLVPNPPPMPQIDGVPFGTNCTPHMLVIDFADGKWSAPEIKPYADFNLSPNTLVLHYALACFEGMKAYADAKDIERVAAGETLTQQRVRLFRPNKNIDRLQASMTRLCFPSFDKEEFQLLLDEYVKTEASYVPKKEGYSLYLRPTAMAVDTTLAPVQAKKIRLFVIASPVGPLWAPPAGAAPSSSFLLRPVKLLVEEADRRAWPGGTGGSKLSSNYAGPMKAQQRAEDAGYNQVLWLGPNREVQEVGAMNFLVLWRNKATNELELVTAPLDGTVLPGVTRDSILALARGWGINVKEEAYYVEDMIAAIAEGRMVECFGCGTAAIVTSVGLLAYKGVEHVVPCPTEAEGSLTHRCLRAILDIQYGRMEHEWSRPLDA
uniref:Branched-chain-amino-acid transaminase n=1 Tax=Strigomonas galati TaxID=1003336 RepID=U5KLD9_9TRYP|nr:branched-chain-amino-acid transaminase [Strigomonas galati]